MRELLKHLKELDKIRIEYEKLPVEEAVKKAKESGDVLLINRVASFLSCITNEKLERSRRKLKNMELV